MAAIRGPRGEKCAIQVAVDDQCRIQHEDCTWNLGRPCYALPWFVACRV